MDGKNVIAWDDEYLELIVNSSWRTTVKSVARGHLGIAAQKAHKPYEDVSEGIRMLTCRTEPKIESGLTGKRLSRGK
jgi:hypothetical protein